ncbi:MAG: FAD:protein FMN transferase [Patescibacteria group bacterium]|nr:FAD:protein FMN transferase [Patescibacteria group bacterium]MDE2116278.1 FAD:protein FMN transferase [Patescibacteria group bacterium]
MAAHFEFEAIGTTWKIDVPGPMSVDQERDLLVAIRDRIAVFDKAYSRFRSDSLVSEIARRAGEYVMPDDALPMMSLYQELYHVTGGLMTPLVGQVLADAGYDATYTLKPKPAIAKAPAWEEIMSYDHPILTIKQPVLLDFGAVGKGYLIDIISRIIREHGFQSYTVDAGGDIAHRNAIGKTLRVGLEDPADPKKIVGVADIGDRSICGSAGNRRVWDRFHHIIDPKKVESPRHILGLWTVADTTIVADALSTALFFVSPEALVEKLDGRHPFECAILYADRTAYTSKNFPGGLYVIK